mmetsp:Transcript_12368/g.57200  ORF Transcript_12368/g.57200 Transcript_12368/m.57200 type:complete len:247 (+) Transcript_12368:316-1056(+)
MPFDLPSFPWRRCPRRDPFPSFPSVHIDTCPYRCRSIRRRRAGRGARGERRPTPASGPRVSAEVKKFRPFRLRRATTAFAAPRRPPRRRRRARRCPRRVRIPAGNASPEVGTRASPGIRRPSSPGNARLWRRSRPSPRRRRRRRSDPIRRRTPGREFPWAARRFVSSGIAGRSPRASPAGRRARRAIRATGAVVVVVSHPHLRRRGSPSGPRLRRPRASELSRDHRRPRRPRTRRCTSRSRRIEAS